MNYSTTTKNIFGIDPGMANTGWSAVSRNRTGKFILLDSGCIRTPAGHTESVRLLQIYKQISELLNVHTPNAIAIERVFHNKNISSSLTTAAVMGCVPVSVSTSRPRCPVVHTATGQGCCLRIRHSREIRSRKSL